MTWFNILPEPRVLHLVSLRNLFHYITKSLWEPNYHWVLRSPWWSCNISCPVNYAASWQYKVCIKYCPMSQSQHQTRRQTGCLITLVKNIWCSSWKYLVSQSRSWTDVFSASTPMCLEITLFRKLLQRKMLSFRGNDINNNWKLWNLFSGFLLNGLCIFCCIDILCILQCIHYKSKDIQIKILKLHST